MSSRFLVRFDDICPTMNWTAWETIERTLIKNSIAPIMAVVPNNQDPQLEYGPPRDGFWDEVRSWQQRRGWAIGLHGYRHLYESNATGIIGMNARSEFAGLSYEAQLQKLTRAVEHFRAERVSPDLWVAPAHSFDFQTIQALRSLNITTLSDGFFSRPVSHCGMRWVPQQLWHFRNMRFGIWTVAYHLNSCTAPEIDRICADLDRYKDRITSLQQLIAENRFPPLNIFDRAFARFWLWKNIRHRR